jgi:thioredoxin 1
MNLHELRQQLKSHPNPVIVDFWAPWCLPCKITKPILASLGMEYEGRVDVLMINADENLDLVLELNIFGIPTVLATRTGEILQKYPGAQSRENYRHIFESLANDYRPVRVSMSTFDRFIRLFAGAVLGYAGFSSEAWTLLLLGGLIAFLGVYDRCPIWKAITGRFFKKTP